MKELIDELKSLKRRELFTDLIDESDDPYVETSYEVSDTGELVFWEDIEKLIKKYEERTK